MFFPTDEWTLVLDYCQSEPEFLLWVIFCVYLLLYACLRLLHLTVAQILYTMHVLCFIFSYTGYIYCSNFCSCFNWIQHVWQLWLLQAPHCQIQETTNAQAYTCVYMYPCSWAHSLVHVLTVGSTESVASYPVHGRYKVYLRWLNSLVIWYGQYFESDCMGNNSIIKTTHNARRLRHGARDQIFQAPSPFFGGGAWVWGYWKWTFRVKMYAAARACFPVHSGILLTWRHTFNILTYKIIAMCIEHATRASG